MKFIKVNIVENVREPGNFHDKGKYVIKKEIIINLNQIIEIQDNPSSNKDGIKSILITTTNEKHFYITGDYSTILDELNK